MIIQYLIEPDANGTYTNIHRGFLRNQSYIASFHSLDRHQQKILPSFPLSSLHYARGTGRYRDTAAGQANDCARTLQAHLVSHAAHCSVSAYKYQSEP